MALWLYNILARNVRTYPLRGGTRGRRLLHVGSHLLHREPKQLRFHLGVGLEKKTNTSVCAEIERGRKVLATIKTTCNYVIL